MRLFVIGANGRTGREILDLARARGHEVTAFVRSPEKLEQMPGVRVVRGDPRQVDATALALPGHDAVLSAIGPHPRDALLGPRTLVADCARATVDAMTASGVGRLAIVTLVTRLCINELDSARMRREESRGDRLPEPVDLDEGGIGRVEAFEQISMAFLVVLQRLTPAERTVLLLREVFDFDYQEIAALVGRSEAACRKLLERARQHVAAEKPLFAASPEDHRRLLDAFSQAASDGNITALVAMLAQDAVMVTDGGPEGRRVAGIRNLPRPLTGAARIAAFVAATARSVDLEAEVHDLNGQPALVFYHENDPFAALLLAIANGRIHRVFFHADLERLRYLGPRAAR